jgi:hypothetical protein
MAVMGQKKRFALDSNILIDLGEQKDFAHTFLRVHRAQGFAVPPTVVQELLLLAENKSHQASQAALIALSNIRHWDILPYDLISLGHGITDINTHKLMARGLLPEDEYNDGSIIIETALACIPVLVTSDNHLLRINPSQLAKALIEFDLQPITIIHPKELQRPIISVRKN